MAVIYELWNCLIIQFRQILPWWLLGALSGALVIAFAGDGISKALSALGAGRFPLPKLALASLLGAASPLCMYGTVPLICSFGKKGVPQHLLAAFMAGSVLINPNLFAFSFALGAPVALLRLGVCLLAGTLAGLLVKLCFGGRPFFRLEGYVPKSKAKPGMKPLRRVFAEFNNTIVRTAPYVLAGIALTALFEAFVPKDIFRDLFSGSRGLGVLLAAGLGVPVYLCGGGTIPLLKGWLGAGMSLGSAVAFMVTGPATKFSNLGAVKIILGMRNFILYILYMAAFSVISGIATDFIHTIMGQAGI